MPPLSQTSQAMLRCHIVGRPSVELFHSCWKPDGTDACFSDYYWVRRGVEANSPRVSASSLRGLLLARRPQSLCVLRPWP